MVVARVAGCAQLAVTSARTINVAIHQARDLQLAALMVPLAITRSVWLRTAQQGNEAGRRMAPHRDMVQEVEEGVGVLRGGGGVIRRACRRGGSGGGLLRVSSGVGGGGRRLYGSHGWIWARGMTTTAMRCMRWT
jgi:hypothetical protein